MSFKFCSLGSEFAVMRMLGSTSGEDIGCILIVLSEGHHSGFLIGALSNQIANNKK